MKQILRLTTTLIVLLFLGGSAWGQILTFEFNALTGNEATAPSNSNDANLTSSIISRGAGLTASLNADRFNATSWAVTSIANAVTGNDYMEFTITPQSGYQFSVSSIYFQIQRSSTGPRGIALRNSVDSYAANLDQEYAITDNTSTQNFTFTFSQSNSSTAVTYRIYMWAESTGGSGGIGDGSGGDIIVYGTTSSTSSGPDNPGSFTATAASTTQINLAATANGASDDIMVAYNSSNTFGTPTGTYTAGNNITGGGTVHYVGVAVSLSNHTGLDANTQYFYKAWSVNGSNEYSTGLTADATTDAAEPSNHPTGFGATANSDSEITLEWTHVDGSQAASNYLILAKKGAGTFATVADGSFVADDTDWNDNNAAINVTKNAQATQSYQFTGLTAGTTYDFIIYPYNGSGATVNYKTDSPPTGSATTFGNDTEVYAPTTQIAAKDISSLADTPAEGQSINVFVITIEDQGTGDGQPTKVTNIRVKPHTSNTADWTNTIQGVYVDDDSDYVYPTATDITDTYIDLSFGISDLNVADNSSLDVTLYIYLHTSGIIDGQILSFMVDADDHGFTADASGSGFVSSFYLGDFNSNDMTIDVEATQLQFKEQPTNVQSNTSITPAPTVAFTDANGNIELDLESANVRMTATGATLTGSPVDVAIAASGLATFSTLQFSTTGTGVTLTASDSDDILELSASVNSDAFDVTELPKLLISEVADPSDAGNAKFIELYNAGASTIDFDTDTWYISRQANGGTWADLLLTGSVAAGETFVVAYTYATAPNYDSEYGVTSDMSSGFVSGNGNDGYFLYQDADHATGTLVDAYGVIDEDGTGKTWEYTNSKAVRKNTVTAPNTTWTASEWTIVSSCNAARMTPAMHPASAWNGYAKSNDWTAAGNWDNGLTGSGISAHIPSGLTNYPTITAAATIEDLRMGNGATLLGGEYLTINGTASVQKNIAGYTGLYDGWHIVTSPLNGAAIPGSDWAPVSGEDDFYVYDPATNIWRNYLDGTNASTWFDYFDAGQGYLVAYHPNNDGIKTFVATTLNSDATYTFNLVFHGTDSHNWNFAGNPYPSNITGGEDGYLASSMKTLNVTDGSYDDMNTGLNICDGFVVYAEGNGAYIETGRTYQTHTSQTAKQDKGENRMKLIAASANNTVHAWMVVDELSTTAFEWQTDSRYLAPVTDLPRLSMLTSDEIEVSTNCFSISRESTVIPVKFSVLQDETITFSLEDFSGSLGVKNVILEDQANNTFTTLSEGNTYKFDATTGDDPMRFKLHVNGATGIGDLTNADLFTIYSSGKTIYLSSSAQDATVNIYNNLGQLVVSKQLKVDGLTSFDVQTQTGWYIVKVSTQEGIATQKVFIQNN
jgi:hypothetical protein